MSWRCDRGVGAGWSSYPFSKVWWEKKRAIEIGTSCLLLKKVIALDELRCFKLLVERRIN